MSTNEFQSARAPAPVGLYPHARRAGGLLFLSGIGPRKPGTNEIPDSFEEQCRSCFANVKAVLEDAGAKWEDLVDVTVFLTDMKRDFATYNRLYAEHFASARPCRTTVEVGALPTAISIELKCIAEVR
ncbi:MAG TPA: RidA family protein [Myxococcales bacterium]|nr:RidA family protein [Myxococcales bacterium]